MKKILILFLLLTNVVFALSLGDLTKQVKSATAGGGGGECALSSVFDDIKKSTQIEIQKQLKDISSDFKIEAMRKLDNVKDDLQKTIMEKVDSDVIGKAKNLVNKADMAFESVMGYVGYIKIVAIITILVLISFIIVLTLSIRRIKHLIKINQEILVKINKLG
ncbi:MAG: hypothetical protein LBT02_02580 [Rickettsiales bacterium]|jgi:hypothetical protein|nr:hypothetical protein [Rickettsiales bacterium]